MKARNCLPQNEPEWMRKFVLTHSRYAVIYIQTDSCYYEIISAFSLQLK